MELLLDIGYHHYCYHHLHQYCHHHLHRLQQLSSVGVQGGGRRCESHKNYLPAEARQSGAEQGAKTQVGFLPAQAALPWPAGPGPARTRPTKVSHAATNTISSYNLQSGALVL